MMRCRNPNIGGARVHGDVLRDVFRGRDASSSREGGPKWGRDNYPTR